MPGKTFTIDRSLLGGQVDVQLTAQGPDSDAPIQALVHNTPFPDGELTLGGITLSASTGKSIPFGAGRDTVTFSANDKGYFAAGVYSDPAHLKTALSPERDIAAGLDLAAQTDSRFLMVRAGYDAGVTVQGAMALATGVTGKFGGSLSRKADYAVIHEFANSAGAHDVLDASVRSGILPGQFDGPDAAGKPRQRQFMWRHENANFITPKW